MLSVPGAALAATGRAPADAPEMPVTTLPNGRFYTEASGTDDGRGFTVLDETWGALGEGGGSDGAAGAGRGGPLEVRFFSEFQRLGEVAGAGYPASRPFEMDGFVVQAMQKGVFQWRPDAQQAWFLNLFDLFHDRGLDDRLLAERQVPRLTDWSSDAGLPWEQVRARHLAVLDAYPRFRARYDAATDPLSLYGLPMSDVVDFGPFRAVRLQRAVFQEYRVAMPYAQPGDVLVVNGGDIAKEYSLVPAWAAAPLGPPRWSDLILTITPAPGDTVGVTFRAVGDARVFEAQFAWEIRNAGGAVLRRGQARAAACCDWARFFIDIDLSGLPAQPITLALYQPSPRDGSPQGTLEIPLRYAP